MTRRTFVLMFAAALVPRQRPDRIYVPGPLWTTCIDEFHLLKQRFVYTAMHQRFSADPDLAAVRRRVYKWKVRYVTAAGETLARRGGR